VGWRGVSEAEEGRGDGGAKGIGEAAGRPQHVLPLPPFSTHLDLIARRPQIFQGLVLGGPDDSATVIGVRVRGADEETEGKRGGEERERVSAPIGREA
jgi:hypothetical protein